MAKSYSIEGRQPGSRIPAPVKMFIGRRNIRISETGSAAVLGRQMQAAFDELTGDLTHFFRQLNDALPEDMAAALEPTLEKSQEMCPKDTNELVDSSYLEVVGFRNGARAEMGYGKNGAAPYGVYVHEMPYNHEAPTRNKFLQVPVEQDYFNILQRVADRVKVRLGLAGG